MACQGRLPWKQSSREFVSYRKSNRLNSTLSLYDALPIYLCGVAASNSFPFTKDDVIRPDGLPGTFTVETIKPGVCVISEEQPSELHSFPIRRSSDLPLRCSGE